MSTTTPTTALAGGPMTVDQYESLVDSGVLTKRDRFHLINGSLVPKVTKKPPHVLAADLVSKALARVVSSGWWIRIEAPVCLPPKSEPEPDVSMARGSNLDYADHHPGPADLALVVEVAYSTLDAVACHATFRGRTRIHLHRFVFGPNIVVRRRGLTSP